MGLEGVFKFGYAMLVATIAMMIYVSLAASEIAPENDAYITYPPCYFNPLCTCSKTVPDLGRVTCENVPLSRIPRQINNSKVYALALKGNGLRYIEPYFLEGTNLYRIEVSRNNLSEIVAEAFAGLERTLRQLDLHSNRLTSVPSRSIRHLQKLSLLNLTDNDITDLAPENWRGVEESLEVLILRDNGISSLLPDIFSPLQSLETLDLSGNTLLDLSPNTFHDGLSRLTRLFLQDNAISTLPYEQLASLRSLQYLDISRNRISQLHNLREDGTNVKVSLSLDTLRLEYNQLQYLPSRAFENFRAINTSYLDGNPIAVIQMDAFQGPKIKQLYMRDCGIAELAPGALSGLEPTLTLLDLTGNNLTNIPHRLFDQFDFLKTISLKNNLILGVNPHETFTGFKYSLIHLDMSGSENSMVAIQDLKKMRNLRSLSLSRLPHDSLRPEDFLEFGVDLRELKISNGNLRGVQNHAFKNLQSLERLDLSENSINSIENDAFAEVGDSLTYLNLASGFSSSVSKLPNDAFRPLTAMQRLDISNNKIKTLPETSFHFMKNLQSLHMEDNLIENIPKGTFQGDIHSHLEKIFLSFNQLSTISTHSFVDLRRLDTLRLDDNRLTRIEKRAFMNLEKLRDLNLRGNKLNKLSEEAFQNIPALQELDLAYNELNRFDFSCLDQVGTLSFFKVNVSHNSLKYLEGNTTQYVSDRMRGGVVHTNIVELDFSHNNISYVGRWYFRPVESSLTHLFLSHNSLRNVSKELLGNMKHLQWLDLSYNTIEELDFDSFKATFNLQVLFLRNNKLQELPTDLFRGLQNLRVVDLSYNKLRSLPDMMFFDRVVEVLRLEGNQLTKIPVSTFSSDAASSLVELDISNNAIASLHPPDFFARFQSLQRLDISGNRLVRVEDGAFAQMPLLSVLDLSGNTDLTLDSRGMTFHGIEHSLQELYLRNLSMHSVPEMHLPALRLIDLSDNQITSIPQDLPQNLTSLRTLRLSGNSLDNVPPFLTQFTQLRTLSLARNPLPTLTFPQGLRLRELDVRHLPLESFEMGTLGKIPTLRTLRVSPSSNSRAISFPQLLQENYGLEILHIEADGQSSTLDQEMNGPLPLRLNRIEVSGRGVKSLGNNFLQGVRSPVLTLVVHNTSIDKIPRSVFQQARNIRSLRLDVRSNSLKVLGNPNTAGQPGMARKTFLMDLKIAGNKWTCDCELGWIEGWERKKRQYFCTETWDSCKTNEDDLREALCENKRQQRLLDVLKADVECGWNSASTVYTPVVTAIFSFVAFLLTRTV